MAIGLLVPLASCLLACGMISLIGTGPVSPTARRYGFRPPGNSYPDLDGPHNLVVRGVCMLFGDQKTATGGQLSCPSRWPSPRPPQSDLWGVDDPQASHTISAGGVL